MCKELMHLRTQACNFQVGCSLNSFSGAIEETISRSYLGLIREREGASPVRSGYSP